MVCSIYQLLKHLSFDIVRTAKQILDFIDSDATATVDVKHIEGRFQFAFSDDLMQLEVCVQELFESDLTFFSQDCLLEYKVDFYLGTINAAVDRLIAFNKLLLRECAISVDIKLFEDPSQYNFFLLTNRFCGNKGKHSLVQLLFGAETAEVVYGVQRQGFVSFEVKLDALEPGVHKGLLSRNALLRIDLKQLLDKHFGCGRYGFPLSCFETELPTQNFIENLIVCGA